MYLFTCLSPTKRPYHLSSKGVPTCLCNTLDMVGVSWYT